MEVLFQNMWIKYRFSVLYLGQIQASWWDICNKMLFNIFGLNFEDSRSGETRSLEGLIA